MGAAYSGRAEEAVTLTRSSMAADRCAVTLDGETWAMPGVHAAGRFG